MRFDIVTIFPGFFDSPLRYGVLSRAIETDLVQVRAHDLREQTTDKHRTVDDRPFGGGEGMVLKPEPIFAAVEALSLAEKVQRNRQKEKVILLSAQGQRFTQRVAEEISGLERVVLICGRYEGVDERVANLLADMELSVGDYVLSGGELAALIVIDSVTRLLPGVLGNEASSRFESFGPGHLADANAAEQSARIHEPPSSTHAAGGLLDYPHYTRPQEFRGAVVPEVLAGGNHEQIRRWRRERALEKTFRNRPDLLENAALSPEDRKFLKAIARAQSSDPL